MSDYDEIDKKLEELKPFFAQNDEEAEKRAKEYKEKDPFPDITPALLNTADILDYVAKTGMIHPFHLEKKLLKPASYSVRLLGKCVFFDEHGEKQSDKIEKDKDFILRKNSIAFVTLEPYFRLPDYMALRFNFTIKNVYRGLLLGTGPLVDPGFDGYLSIPIHNMTTNDYILKGGDDIVYFEFTKISKNERWNNKYSKTQNGFYIPFPERKLQRKEIEDYLSHASPFKPVRNSIPEAIELIKEDAEKAKEDAKKSADSVAKITKWGYLGLAVAIFAIIFSFCSLVYTTWSFVEKEKDSRISCEKEQKALNDSFSSDIKYLKEENMILKNRMDSTSIKNNKK